ncbi:MAG: hypothetical protein RIC95_07770 [Vicingaceae bacterium]
MREEDWIIASNEEEGQMVTVTIEAPNSNFQYQNTIGFTNGDSDIPAAIVSFLSKIEYDPEYLMVFYLEFNESAGSNVFSIGASESVFESVNPDLTPNGEFIVYDTSNSVVKAGGKTKGRVKL